MESNDLTVVLPAIVGFVLSILMYYWPWFRALSDTDKRVATALLLLAAALAVYGLTCAGWLALVFPNLALTCDQPGLVKLLKALFVVLFSNQSTYTLFYQGKVKRSRAVADYQEG